MQAAPSIGAYFAVGGSEQANVNTCQRGGQRFPLKREHDSAACKRQLLVERHLMSNEGCQMTSDIQRKIYRGYEDVLKT
jgi:hypothetical protein